MSQEYSSGENFDVTKVTPDYESFLADIDGGEITDAEELAARLRGRYPR
jgi:hypothetical protein